MSNILPYFKNNSFEVVDACVPYFVGTMAYGPLVGFGKCAKRI